MSQIHEYTNSFARNALRSRASAPGLRITAAKMLFPGQTYSTEQVRDLLMPTIEATSRRLQRAGAAALEPTFGSHFLARLGVHTRSLAVDPSAPHLWWQRERSTDPIARVGAACFRALMAERQPLSEGDKVIAVSNAYDTTCPNLVTHILNDLQRDAPGFNYPEQLSLLGDGCSGFISALREANTHLRAFPESRVVIVADELTSQHFYNPELLETLTQRAENAGSAQERKAWANVVRGLFIQRFLFGDGVVAVMCESDRMADDGLRLNTFRRWTNLDPDDIDIFGIRGMGTKGESTAPYGYFFQDPKRLFARLQEAYIPAMAKGLAEASCTPDAFAVHTGSGPILEQVFHGLQIPSALHGPSVSVLRDHGNMNTASGAAITAELLNGAGRVPANPFLAFFGVGFTAQVAYYE
ncbi:MAG: hypothetical protein MJE77_30360 [Proteobacteria bacterium]|nr:hypothetical protein [Pseudomonadota bacterium]